MSTRSKARTCKTCVKSVLTYAIETRAKTAATKKLLRTIGMRTLKSIAACTLVVWKRNELIRKQCGIQGIVTWSRQRLRKWKDCVDRMSGKRFVPSRMPHKRQGESWKSQSETKL